MNVRPKFPPQQPMSIESFLAFTDACPPGELWELIEGVPVLSPSPVQIHQLIAGNIVGFLLRHKERAGASWIALLGVGTRVPVSPDSLPRPDVYVQAAAAEDSAVTDDALVIFEVLSRSNKKRDRDWRHKVYSSVPNCQHYVTVSTTSVEVIRHSRTSGWTAERIRSRTGTLDLPAIGVAMPLADIYRWTPLDRA